MNVSVRFFALLVLLITSTAAHAANLNTREVVLRGEGTIKDADALNDGVLFKIAYEHRMKDGRSIATQIRQYDLSGQLLVDEQTTYDSKGQFQQYTMTQHQTGDRSKVETQGEQVVMTFIENNKTTTTRESFSSNTNAPGSLMAYLAQYTQAIERGEKVPVKLAVPERGMVLGFEIANAPDQCRGTGSDLCVNLALSNFFLKKLLKPVFMSFQKSPQGYRPLALETPALVRRRKGSSLEKFTARIDYQKL